MHCVLRAGASYLLQGLEDFEDGAVGLPQELEPGHHHVAVGALLVRVLRHGRQHDALGVQHLRPRHDKSTGERAPS